MLIERESEQGSSLHHSTAPHLSASETIRRSLFLDDELKRGARVSGCEPAEIAGSGRSLLCPLRLLKSDHDAMMQAVSLEIACYRTSTSEPMAM